jgi:hypothetical protein
LRAKAADILEVDAGAVTVELTIAAPAGVSAEVQEYKTARAAAVAAQTIASAARNHAVIHLREQGMIDVDIAQVLGITPKVISGIASL